MCACVCRLCPNLLLAISLFWPAYVDTNRFIHDPSLSPPPSPTPTGVRRCPRSLTARALNWAAVRQRQRRRRHLRRSRIHPVRSTVSCHRPAVPAAARRVLTSCYQVSRFFTLMNLSTHIYTHININLNTHKQTLTHTQVHATITARRAVCECVCVCIKRTSARMSLNKV